MIMLRSVSILHRAGIIHSFATKDIIYLLFSFKDFYYQFGGSILLNIRIDFTLIFFNENTRQSKSISYLSYEVPSFQQFY